MFMTSADVQEILRSNSRSVLYELCQDSFKDLYGIPSQHMVNYTVDQLVDWWLGVYEWNAVEQCWDWNERILADFERDNKV